MCGICDSRVAEATRVKSVALTDLQSGNGAVKFCSAETAASPVEWPASSGLDPDGMAPDRKALVENKIRKDLDDQSIFFDAMSHGNSELWLYYENYRYDKEAQAIGRIIRVLMADAPSTIEIFHIIAAQRGISQREITVSRSGFERSLQNPSSLRELDQAVTLSAPPLDDSTLSRQIGSQYPRLGWSLDPKVTEHIFDPNQPLQFMIYADAAMVLELRPGLMVGTELTGNLWNDFQLTRPADSALPHVRTDLLQYIKEGANGISSLEVTYQARLSGDVFTEIKAGYLEDMFMGVGGEVLWRPEGSRLAFGADLYQVWKRDFNRLFGAQDYNVLTGHASIYYHSPWYGLNFNVHMGRYLAGDHGATLEITREFDSGIEIGAFATLTNVSSAQFGEGSFDKGLIVHIPMEWALPVFSQSSYDVHLSALTRDGGQRLDGDDDLYYQTRHTSEGEIAEHFDDLATP